MIFCLSHRTMLHFLKPRSVCLCFFLLLKNKRDKRSYLCYVCPSLNFPSSPSESLFSCAPLSVSELPDWQDATLIFTTVSPFTQCCESAVGLPLHQPRETHCSRQSETDRQTDRLGGRRWETVMIMMCVSMGGWHLWQHVSSADPDTTRERQGGHCFPVAAFGSLSGSYDDKSRAKHMCMFKLKECKIQKKLRSLYSIVGIINVLRFKLN